MILEFQGMGDNTFWKFQRQNGFHMEAVLSMVWMFPGITNPNPNPKSILVGKFNLPW